MKKVSSKIEKIINFCDKNYYSLSFGLAPNPFGFSFIFDGKKRDKNKDKKLDRRLSDLSEEETKELRANYF